jgi:hypothetical protein
MDFWDLPSGEPPPRRPNRGFGDAVRELEDRKYRELGAAWERIGERKRRAEARRRARREMARRIAQRTGKRALSERTIARRARDDNPPGGVERHWLDRWAAIDRAGGIKKLSEQLGASERHVRRWRDSADPDAPPPGEPPAGVRRVPGAPTHPIGVETDGWVVINGKPYPKRIPTDPDEDYAVLYVDPAGDLMRAYLDNDVEVLKELLGDEIAMQIIIPTWMNLPSTYEVGYLVDEILQFLPDL